MAACTDGAGTINFCSLAVKCWSVILDSITDGDALRQLSKLDKASPYVKLNKTVPHQIRQALRQTDGDALNK